MTVALVLLGLGLLLAVLGWVQMIGHDWLHQANASADARWGGRGPAAPPRTVRRRGPAVSTLGDRFWARVNKTEGCWVWIGPTNNRGYGMLTDGARYRTTHRISWELHNGSIPEGMRVLHRCDNPPCIRPDHLFLGTQSDNMRDCRDKGRLSSRLVPGERHTTAKLTEADVRVIKRRLASGERRHAIAADYSVHESTIRRIARGRGWQWVSES